MIINLEKVLKILHYLQEPRNLCFRHPQGEVGQKSVFLKYLNLNSKLEILTVFPVRFMDYQIF